MAVKKMNFYLFSSGYSPSGGLSSPSGIVPMDYFILNALFLPLILVKPISLLKFPVILDGMYHLLVKQNIKSDFFFPKIVCVDLLFIGMHRIFGRIIQPI
jgi:hypothetical protein